MAYTKCNPDFVIIRDVYLFIYLFIYIFICPRERSPCHVVYGQVGHFACGIDSFNFSFQGKSFFVLRLFLQARFP